ncbi:hypothetical protein EVC02_086 [Rhizobium phage RHph_N17]|nr:hypothetical protein EVC02_086 [Rhizobium phage RHph_N17]
MALFRRLENVIIILNTNGVYTQVDGYERNNYVYAKKGGGFIGLRSNGGGTTSPTTLWSEIEGLTPVYDELGRMVVKTERIRKVA